MQRKKPTEKQLVYWKSRIGKTYEESYGLEKAKSMKEKSSLRMKSIKNPNWHGGKSITWDGYIYIEAKNHPYANYYGYVLEHRLIMEKKLNRILSPIEVVHHINGNRQDNRIENLQLFDSNESHTTYHNLKRKEEKCIV